MAHELLQLGGHLDQTDEREDHRELSLAELPPHRVGLGPGRRHVPVPGVEQGL